METKDKSKDAYLILSNLIQSEAKITCEEILYWTVEKMSDYLPKELQVHMSDYEFVQLFCGGPKLKDGSERVLSAMKKDTILRIWELSKSLHGFHHLLLPMLAYLALHGNDEWKKIWSYYD